MTPLSVKAPSSKMGVRLKLIYKSTTTVFNILFMFCFILKVMHDFVAGTFWDTLYTKIYLHFF